MQQIELPGIRQPQQEHPEQQPADNLISRRQNPANPNAEHHPIEPIRGPADQTSSNPPRNTNTTITQTNKDYDRSILNYQFRIFALIALIQLFNAIYILLFCWINKGACISDGTEIRKWCPGCSAAVFFITIILGYICYESSQSASKVTLRRIKWVNALYIIFTLVLGIIGFATSATIDTTSLDGVWGSFTQYEKIYFSNLQSNLVNTYKINLILFGIYMVVLGGLFIILTCGMFQYDVHLQDGWRPAVKERSSFAKELFLKFRREYEAIPINATSPEINTNSPPKK